MHSYPSSRLQVNLRHTSFKEHNHQSSSWVYWLSKMSHVSSGNHCRSDPVQVQSTPVMEEGHGCRWAIQRLPCSNCKATARSPSKAGQMLSLASCNCSDAASRQHASCLLTIAILFEPNWNSFTMASSGHTFCRGRCPNKAIGSSHLKTVWPSGLRRQTQVLVRVRVRGFEPPISARRAAGYT